VEKTKGYHILDMISPDYTTPSPNNGDNLHIYTYTTKPMLKYATVDSLSGTGNTVTLYYTVDGSQPSPKSISGTGKGLLSLDNDASKNANPLPDSFKTAYAFTDPSNPKAVYKAVKIDVNSTINSVIITLDNPVLASSHITMDYKDPTKNDDFYAIQDTLGNDAISFTGINITSV
jgi:hypothetical protein